MARFNPLNYYNCCNPDNARGQKTLPYNIFSQNHARGHCHAWHEFLTLRRKDAKIFVVGGLDGLDGWHPHAYSAYELHEFIELAPTPFVLTLRRKDAKIFVVGGLDGLDGWHPHCRASPWRGRQHWNVTDGVETEMVGNCASVSNRFIKVHKDFL